MRSLRLLLAFAAIPTLSIASDHVPPAPATPSLAKASANLIEAVETTPEAKPAQEEESPIIKEARRTPMPRSILPRPNLVPNPPNPAQGEPPLRSIPTGSPVGHLRQAAEHLRQAGMHGMAQQVESMAGELKGTLIAKLNEKREELHQIECDIADLEREIGSQSQYAATFTLIHILHPQHPSVQAWQKIFEGSDVGSEAPHQARVPQKKFQILIDQMTRTHAARLPVRRMTVAPSDHSGQLHFHVEENSADGSLRVALELTATQLDDQNAKLHVKLRSSMQPEVFTRGGSRHAVKVQSLNEDLVGSLSMSEAWVFPIALPPEGQWFLALTLSDAEPAGHPLASRRLEPIPDGQLFPNVIPDAPHPETPGHHALPNVTFVPAPKVFASPREAEEYAAASRASAGAARHEAMIREFAEAAANREAHLQRMRQIQAGPGMAIIEMGIPFEQPAQPFVWMGPGPTGVPHGGWNPASPHYAQPHPPLPPQAPGIHLLPTSPNEPAPRPNKPILKVGQQVVAPGQTTLSDAQPSDALIPLGSITVNLNEGRMNRYLRADIVLKVKAEHAGRIESEAKSHEAEIRSWLIQHLSDKSLDDVRGSQGQQEISKEIHHGLKNYLGGDSEKAITAVLFTDFQVQ